MKKLLIIIFLSLSLGCGSKWVHKDGKGEEQLKTDSYACEIQAQAAIKEKFGYDTCKDYAYEEGMERPAYAVGGFWKLGVQPVPNKRDYKKAVKECNLSYEDALNSCMTDKGWQEAK